MFSLDGTMSEQSGLTIGEAPPSVDHAELRGRQQSLAAQLPIDALLIIVNNPEAVRSRDVEYPYRANSDMLYLTGWEESNAVACLHYGSDGWKTRMFVPPRDVLAETWKAGEEVVIADLKAETRGMCTGVRWIRSRRPDLYVDVATPTGREQDIRTVRFSKTDPDI